MKAPTLAPVKRYSWRANKMTTLSSPGMNVWWSVCHKDETVLKKSCFVKLSFSFFWSTTTPSAVKVFLIHCIQVSLRWSQRGSYEWTNHFYFLSIVWDDFGSCELFKSTKESLGMRTHGSHRGLTIVIQSPLNRIYVPANIRFDHLMCWSRRTEGSFIIFVPILRVCSEPKGRSAECVNRKGLLLQMLRNSLEPKVHGFSV